MVKGKKSIFSRKYLYLIAGFAAGGLLILLVRFVTYSPERVHYHANLAVYVNGQREQFKDAFYYEEVGSCTADKTMTPNQRAHMHDNINGLVHVHDHAVTWNNFFENLGWEVNPLFVKAADKLYLTDGQNKVSFILNGQAVDNVAGRVIGDRDRLLVDFGSTSSAGLQQEFAGVASTAARADASKDPAACGGGATPTFNERLRHVL